MLIGSAVVAVAFSVFLYFKVPGMTAEGIFWCALGGFGTGALMTAIYAVKHKGDR